MHLDRRSFLWNWGGGLACLALADLLGRSSAQAAAPDLNGGLHHPAKAKRMVQLFMSGGASHIDTFDYKPELNRRSGEKFDPGGKVELFISSPGPLMGSPWSWKQHGATGRWASELVPKLAEQSDEMAFVHSMLSKTNVHGPATFMQNTGFILPGFPSLGAWLSFGLGSLNDNLPTFVVLPNLQGLPPNGAANWASAFLPAAHQGTMIRAGRPNPIHDLFPPEDAAYVTKEGDADGLRTLRELNQQHLEARGADSMLEGRIQSYELAAKLQLSAPEALDIASEPPAVRKLYGVDDPVTRDFGTRCLMARRLLERGVRFVQVWSGADNGLPRRNWDSHEDLLNGHTEMCREMDGPAAALLQDLKATGLLEDTIVHWTTEFGRMPCSQGGKGRDHNPSAFTSWLAGGGVKAGATHGRSDEWGYRVAEDPTYCYDIHATLLHLMGIDHERLTFRHNGIDRRLTDVHGRVLKGLLA